MPERPVIGDRRPETATLPAPAITGGMDAAPYSEIANNVFTAMDGSVAVPDGLGGTRIVSPQELAAQNEQVLKPFAPGGVPQAAVQAAPAGVVPAASAAGAQRPAGRRIAGAPPPPAGTPKPPAVPASAASTTKRPVQAAPNQPDKLAVAVAAGQARPALSPGGASLAVAARQIGALAQRSTHPAASDTDSPSRGIPRAQSDDPGKQVTGGFGDAGAAQYYPLDGSELLQVVWVLMDEVAKRIVNDLRFSVAATYPRVSAKVQVVIEGFTLDEPINIERVDASGSKTPQVIAEKLADEVVFVVKAHRREFDQFGQPETAPNAMRAEIGAEIPRKQFVGSGNNRQVVDRVG